MWVLLLLNAGVVWIFNNVLLVELESAAAAVLNGSISIVAAFFTGGLAPRIVGEGNDLGALAPITGGAAAGTAKGATCMAAARADA